jgi:general secretion pathway protein K
MMPPAARARERGVALLLAMGVVALAALAAVAMLASQSAWSRRVEIGAEYVQAQALVQAGVDWARAVLGDDGRASSVDHLGEPWALRVPPVPVDNGELAGQIDDQQGAFNLNNLLRNGAVSAPHVAQFGRLLQILGMPDALAASLAGWLRPAGEGPVRPLLEVGDLALVPGFGEKERARLQPFVTALPRFTTLNVNTASPEVLAAVLHGLQLDDARALTVSRSRAYFRNVAEFLARLPPGAAADGGDLGIASQYFLASVRVTIGDAQARGSALLVREPAGWPTVLWRKYP